MSILTVYPYNQKVVGIYFANVLRAEDLLFRYFGQETVILNSARAALYEAMRFFQMSRKDHILIPDFLSQCVLSILNKTSFPVKRADERTKAVLVLHQWGYPQKMDEVMAEAKTRGLTVIEDCAHTFDSKYKGQRVGTFGEAAIYSFSKLFSTVMGGCLTSGRRELIKMVKKERDRESGLSKKFISYLSYFVLKRYWAGHEHPFLIEICYSQYSNNLTINPLALRRFPYSSDKELDDLIAGRKKNYLYLKLGLKSGYLIPDLESEIEVMPFCMPVFAPIEKMPTIMERLKQKKIIIERWHFDINRNVFSPSYQECLAIPCHQYLKEKDLDTIVEAVNNA